MAKTTSRFVCGNCGYQTAKWLGKCPECQEWNTFVEETVEKTPAKSIGVKTGNAFPVYLNSIRTESTSRFSSGIDELDNVLGGGIVPASVVLIGGDPGVGKSTVLTQVCAHVSTASKALYITAEESGFQVKMRCERLNLPTENFLVLNETDLDEIAAVIESGGYTLCVIDSIQAIYSSALNSASGSVGQIRECAGRLMRIAKNTNTAVFIVGHVTKEGSIAGPKVLEHMMDTVLYFEGEDTGAFRILRAVKNRFGSTNEIGIMEMREDGVFGVKNPSALLLSENRGKSAGAVATTALEGTRCFMVELQSLVTTTVFGLPRRMGAGLDYNKLILMTAVLEKRGGVTLGNQDIYVNVMGGIRLAEPSADLAIAAAVLSAARNAAIPKSYAVFGEVGLTGEVRAVSQVEKRIKECIKMGIEHVVLPKANLKSLEKYRNQINLIGISHIYSLVKEMSKFEG